MKVSLNWLKELVDYQLTPDELANKLSLSSIGVKEFTKDYLELDLTYNRGDLLSLRGVAYEVSAITESPLKLLSSIPQDFIWVNKKLPKTPVSIDHDKLSKIQCVAKIEGLKVEASPEKWQKKLEESGIRSINNIVDITNLVMIEYGQPLHAFDAKNVESDTINVRHAKQGEEIITLDNKSRILTTGDIVLADTKKALDVAGIMGGRDTQIKLTTSTILLSASIFDPTMVRKTSKRLGLYSEASKRFQHGLSRLRALQAFEAAIKLYESIGGKLTAINMVGNFNISRKIIDVDIDKINTLLGEKLTLEVAIKCLQKLNFTLEVKSETEISVIPPYFRLDINTPEDVVEEIARIYGYENITGKPLKDEKPIKIDQSLLKSISKLKTSLVDLGFSEVQTYSFFSSETITNMELRSCPENLITIANPISTETQYMRTDIWPNLLEVINKNLRKGYKDIAIFELGKVYKLKKGQLPNEIYRLCIALCNETDNPLQELFDVAKSLSLQPELASTKISDFFHPNRQIKINNTEKQIGFIAETHLKLLNKYGIEKRVAVMEIIVTL